MADGNEKLRAKAEAAELRLKAATAAAQLRLVRNATPGGSASASLYRAPVRQSGYAVATDTRRAGAKRFAGGGADRHLTPAALAAMRNTCRDMERNNVVAATLLARIGDMVVPDVMRLQGRSEDDGWNTFLEERWAAWIETAVVNGRMGALDLMRWIVRQPAAAGDAAIVKYGDEAGPELAGRIHLVEAEAIDAAGTSLAAEMPYGVKRTEYGALVSICVRQFKKDGSIGPGQVVDAGHVVMVENVSRVSQTRGEPEIHSSIELICDLFDLYQTHLDAARLGATLPLVSSTESPAGFGKQLVGETRLSGYGANGTTLEPGEAKHIEMGTGVNMVNLGKGETIQGVKNEYPSTSMVEFGAAMQGMAGAVCGIPVNILMLNLAEMSYSGGRMALYTALACCKPKRKRLVRTLRELLEWKVISWAFEYARGGGGVGADGKKRTGGLPADWRSYAFVEPGVPSLDPVKDAQAAILRVNNNLTTKRQECEQLDGDFDLIVVQRGLEVAAEAEHGVTPPLAPGAQGGGSPDGGRGGEADGVKTKEEAV